MIKAGARSFHLQPLARCRAAWLFLFAVLGASWTVFPAVSLGGPAILYTFSTLTNSLPGATNQGGAAPAARMALGSDGFLYGTTSRGGSNGAGTIFRLATSPGGFSNLYSFAAATNASGEVNYDLTPGDLVADGGGNFYGTTRSGGSNFTGTIFEVSSSGAFTRLHTFAALTTNSLGQPASSEGVNPVGPLVLAGDGNYYGATQYGGSDDTGTIFRITSAGAFTNLYNFGAAANGAASTNGTEPNGLALGSDGLFLYGTTQKGGTANGGTFFKFSVQGVFSQIYSFDAAAPSENPITPNSPLVLEPNGSFYGTSAFGGSQDGGTIYEITNTGGVSLLHSFPLADAGSGGAALTLLTNNDVLYGTIAADGLNGDGSVFSLTPSGDFAAYSFSPVNTNSDNAGGGNPLAALVQDSAGNLYGTCAAGGTNGSGVVFQIAGPAFFPPSFYPVTNWPPPQTNVLAGASVSFAYQAQGTMPLTFQWLLNGTNLTNGGDITGSTTNNLLINPVNYRDVGNYQLVISNTWGALTSAVTTLTVPNPGISITSPKPNASITAGVFTGTATNAPLFPGGNPASVRLTSVIYSISNFFNGSNITGMTALTSGAGGISNWTFTATPSPGTNILSVQSEDASGNISPLASEEFFYEAATRLTVLTTGSGAATFNITNGATLYLGQSYSITAKPVSSMFSNWISGTLMTTNLTNNLTNSFTNYIVELSTNYSSTLTFVMRSNLVLTAELMAKHLPSIVITSPMANERTNAPLFEGTAATSPVFTGVNPTNVQLTNVVFWLITNMANPVFALTNITGVASLTNGGAVSSWSIPVTNLPGAKTLAVQSLSGLSAILPGSNILAVQAEDISGGLSKIASRSFFYKVPALFTLTNAGNGTGTITGTAVVRGDTPPTNGAMLYLGDTYKVTARAGQFSFFTNWSNSVISNSTSASTYEFYMQSNLILTATFLQTPPVVTISSPRPKERTAAPVFSGTASGHFAISNVFWSLGYTNGSAALTAGSGSVSNWSFSNAPSPGSNILSVYCTDVNSNQSVTVSNKFFDQVPALFTVTNDGTGSGTFRGSASIGGDPVPANGAMLYIGEGYKITAIPDKSSLFSNWVSGALLTTNLTNDLTNSFTNDIVSFSTNFSSTLEFVMQTNLVETATFVTNFFPPLAGAYNGLFYISNAISQQGAGMLDNLVLRDSGAISGRLLTGGTNYTFSSSFNAGGQADFSAGASNAVPVSLTLDSQNLQITGTVTTPSGAASLLADLASNVLPSAQYTILFSPTVTNSPTNSPPGNGYALVALHNGVVTLSGALADGTSYNETVPVSRDGYVPVYASFYRATNTERGLLLGWINLTNLQADYPTNGLTWIKQKISPPPSALYPNSFTENLSLQGALWSNPTAGMSAISLTNGQLIVSETNLSLTYSNVVVSDNNKLTSSDALPTNSLTGSINPKTGLLTVTFGNGKGRSTYNAYGVILQDTTNGGGYFITTNIGGSMSLQPAP